MGKTLAHNVIVVFQLLSLGPNLSFKLEEKTHQHKL